MNTKEMDKFISHCDFYFEQQCDTILNGVLEEDNRHVDVLVYEPNEKYPFWKLVTMGFSDYKMPYIKNPLPRRNEYAIFFDKSITVSKMDKEWLFYLNTLMVTGNAAYCNKEHVTFCHDIQFEMENSDMVATLIMFPEIIENVNVLRCKLGLFKSCAIFQVMPITKEELELDYEKGADWLINNRFYTDENMDKCHYLAEQKRTF